MATYSYRNELIFRSFFNEKTFSTPHRVEDIKFSAYNFNPVSFKFSPAKKGDVYEIPSFINTVSLRNNIGNSTVNELVVPLYVGKTAEYRTSIALINYFFICKYIDNLSLRKGIIKDKVYYGIPGLVLDCDFKPLIVGFTTYEAIGHSIGPFERHILRVSPSIFTSKDPIEKVIITKLIPFYVENNVNNKTVKVEIDDSINEFIAKPVPPKGEIQETFKKMISLYKDEILQDL